MLQSDGEEYVRLYVKATWKAWDACNQCLTHL
jgi:hypothetical protein